MALMRRTPQQIAEEDEILAKAKLIESARKAEEAAAKGPSTEAAVPSGNYTPPPPPPPPSLSACPSL